jgi:hypothetical protein
VTDDNAEKLVMRLRVIKEAKDNNADEAAAVLDDQEGFLRKIENTLLSEMKLRGVERIRKVYMREVETRVIDESRRRDEAQGVAARHRGRQSARSDVGALRRPPTHQVDRHCRDSQRARHRGVPRRRCSARRARCSACTASTSTTATWRCSPT